MVQFNHLVSGAAWNVLSKVLQFGLSLVAIAVIARVIGPGPFGSFALGWVVLGLFEVIVSWAPNDTLVQRKEVRPGHLNATFWCSLTIATFSGLLIAWQADTISNWLSGGELLAMILPLRAAVLPLRALAVVQTALLLRDSRFKAIAALQSLGSVVGSIVAVAMAMAGAGIWSLVAMELAAAVVMLVGVCLLTRWRPGLSMRLKHLTELVAYNISTWGSWGLGYAEDQLPRILIGTTLGPQAVGFYSLAQRLFEQITQIIMIPAYQVVQAGTARSQDDRSQAAELTQGALRIVTVLACPLFLGLSALAAVLVPTVFGNEWLDAVVVVQVLMFSGIRSSISMVQVAVIRGMGKPQWELLSVLLSVTLTGGLLLLVLPYGLAAAAGAVVLAGYVIWPLEAWFVRKLTGLSIAAQGAAGVGPTLASIVMALSVLLIIPPVAQSVGAVATIVIATIFGAMIYWLMLWRLAPAAAQLIGQVIVALARRDFGAVKASIGSLTGQGAAPSRT